MLRRNFIKALLSGSMAVALGPFSLGHAREIIGPADTWKHLKKASWFSKLSGKVVKCDLCHHECLLKNKDTGRCHSRVNIDGTLYSMTFHRPVAIHSDPVEKLPMRHVLPGKSLLAIGTAGCTFSCLYCINSNISQKSPKQVEFMNVSARDLIKIALKRRLPGIAFTYNEPSVAYEFMMQTFRLAKVSGLKTFFHSNGFMKKEPLIELLTITDGIVVDLKAAFEQTYGDLTGGSLRPVKNFIKTVHSSGTFLEIVNLLVPGFNDDTRDIKDIARFVKDELSPEVPLHFSRFFPKYRLANLSPTPTITVKRAVTLAREMGLEYVYSDNVNIDRNDTICPHCGKVLVKRKGSRVWKILMISDHCPFCNHHVPGIWEA